ncbi:rhodanese-related sulfurtransferase [Patescibacteria group bacterium]|nr:rhodanese-related sulfurtransferase [Patescibacteria group bacterium]
MPSQVLLFYKYITLTNPQSIADDIRRTAEVLSLTGRVIVSEEGINATLEGEVEKTEEFVTWIKSLTEFTDLKIKRSQGTGHSFPKLIVKVRNEIVGTRFSLTEADPRVRTAPHLPPEQLRAMYKANEDFVVMDMRNSYEFVSGHFKNSIDPGLRASRDLEKAVLKLEKYKDKKIVTVCTGGIRCEKMSAYLLNKGFTNVYQLEEGIHAYMEKYPGQDFLGTLYTFDDRVVMDFGGEREVVGQCHHCKKTSEHYLNCANDECHLHMIVCEACAPTDKEAFCSTKCRLYAKILQTKKQTKILLQPTKDKWRRTRRHALKKYLRVKWKVRLLMRKSLSNAT